MGLTLREWEKDKEKIAELKDKIYGKYGTSGLHIAELTQRGIVTQLLAHLVKILRNPTDVRNKLVSFLDQVEELVLFVTKEDKTHVQRKCRLLISRVDNNPAHMMIIFGSGFAMNVVLKILKCVKDDTHDYLIKIQEDGLQYIGFIFAPELKGKLTHWSDTLPVKK